MMTKKNQMKKQKKRTKIIINYKNKKYELN